jgi:menaquinone-9 beta-reductase
MKPEVGSRKSEVGRGGAKTFSLPTSEFRLPTSHDALVIGAGPAGSGAAILLAAQGLRVLLVEKSRFPREKLCGEFLSPETLPVFARLGVGERLFEAGAQPINQYTLFAPDGRGVAIPMNWIAGAGGVGLGLSRAAMDAILLNRAREVGVEVREGFHVSPRLARDGDVTLIEGKADGGRVERFAARLVINAAGRHRLFAAPASREPSRLNESRVFGCKVHLRGVAGLDGGGELYFFKDGYGGLSHVEGGRTNLCFLTTEKTLRAAKGDRQKLLEMTLLTNPAARRRLAGASVDGDWLGTGPITYGRQSATPDVLSVGDAGAFIDPFTGSGMLLALHSAELAAAVVKQVMEARRRLDAAEVIARYAASHRAAFGWRFRVSAALRAVAFRPRARNVLASLLTRHASLARLLAVNTRRGRAGAALTPFAD